MNPTRRLCWLLLLVTAGCVPRVHWLREDVHPRAVEGDRRLDHAEIYSGGRVEEWRAVLVTRDSISGVPAAQYAQPGSTRVALPTSAVDSLRVGYPQAPSSTPGYIALFLVLALLTP